MSDFISALSNAITNTVGSVTQQGVKLARGLNETMAPLIQSTQELGKTVSDLGYIGAAINPKSKTLRKMVLYGESLNKGSKAVDISLKKAQQTAETLAGKTDFKGTNVRDLGKSRMEKYWTNRRKVENEDDESEDTRRRDFNTIYIRGRRHRVRTKTFKRRR